MPSVVVWYIAGVVFSIGIIGAIEMFKEANDVNSRTEEALFSLNHRLKEEARRERERLTAKYNHHKRKELAIWKRFTDYTKFYPVDKHNS